MSSDKFDEYLQENEPNFKGVTWQDTILPKIETIVKLTLR